MSKIHIFKTVNKKKVKLSFDEEDYLRLLPRGIKIRQVRNTDYYQVTTANGELVNRLIFGDLKGQHVDHIDRNPLNNCKDNLRAASLEENHRNKRAHKDSIHSKFKGVSYRGKPWMAQIRAGKINRLKSFYTEREAAIQYNEWAKELHGEFAVLNKVDE